MIISLVVACIFLIWFCLKALQLFGFEMFLILGISIFLMVVGGIVDGGFFAIGMILFIIWFVLLFGKDSNNKDYIYKHTISQKKEEEEYGIIDFTKK